MFRISLIIAAVLMSLGIGMGRMAERMQAAPSAQAAVETKKPTNKTAQSYVPENKVRSGFHSIMADGRNHYQAYGRINGRSTKFLVDTGATMVALRSSDAINAGLNPASSGSPSTVMTGLLESTVHEVTDSPTLPAASAVSAVKV